MLAAKRKKKPPHTHTLIRKQEKNLRVYEKAGGVEQEVRG